jgi:fibronectin type 3 domain-containing protein
MKILTILFLLFAPILMFAQTSVKGDLVGNIEWNLSGSPYQIDSITTLNKGAKLIVKEGVKIEFNAGGKLIVLDSMILSGSENNPIVIAGIQNQGQKIILPSSFNSKIVLSNVLLQNINNLFYLASNAGGEMIFEKCKFIESNNNFSVQSGNYTKTNIYIHGCLVTKCKNPFTFGLISQTIMDGNIIKDCSGSIYSNWPQNTGSKIINNVFVGCKDGAIITTDDIYGSLLIKNNQFIYNSSQLISYARPGYPQSGIKNNLIYGNQSSNLISFWITGRPDINFIKGNIILNNSGKVFTTSSSTWNGDLFVSDNWWNNNDTSFIHKNYIQDFNDDYTLNHIFVSPVSETVPDSTPIIPASNLSIIESNNNSISFSWVGSLSKNIVKYKLYYKADLEEDFYSNSIDVGNVTNYTLNNLPVGQKYYIAVTAYDKDGNESWYSNEVIASTTPAPRISADLSSIDFGTVDVRSNNAKSLKITNTGTAALSLKTIQLVNTSFGYSLNVRKLEPGASTTFIALFSPKSTGTYKVDLKIVSDAVNDSILVIPITGYSVRPKAPFIVSVNDVPNDQGGQVRITFQSSRYDGVDSLQKVSSYSVWRKMDENKWDAINQFNAVGDSLYYVVAPSLGDSTVNGTVLSTYKVTAHTADPLIFYTSEPAAGYSKDNIAPEVPKGFMASVANNRVYLKWNPSKEKDFQYYAIYRSTDPNFSADTMKKYTYTTIDTAYVDNNVSMNQKYYYKIAAVDYAGNRSTSTNAEIAVLSDVNDKNKNIPTEYALEQNFPNPFNPSTVIRYSLPYESRVTILIYNSLGQLVSELVDKVEPSGNYEKTFNAGKLPSGIYIYSISVQSTDGKNSFSSVKKMLLIK